MSNPKQWALQDPDYGFKIPFPIEKDQVSSGKWLLPDLKQKKYNVSLKHLVILESQEAVKGYWGCV